VTFDLRPLTFDFLKNEATDLIDNKGSAIEEIRNEATDWGDVALGLSPASAP